VLVVLRRRLYARYVDFPPPVVARALTIFGDLFDTEPARRHFAEYLTGLIVAENKTVSGINRELPSRRTSRA